MQTKEILTLEILIPDILHSVKSATLVLEFSEC